jgi:hypothetical protein
LKPPIQLRVYSRCEIPRAPGPDGIAAVQAALVAAALLSGVLEFILGVRVLGKSIRDTGMQRDMVVLVSDGVSEYLRELLEVCSASSATAAAALPRLRPPRSLPESASFATSATSKLAAGVRLAELAAEDRRVAKGLEPWSGACICCYFISRWGPVGKMGHPKKSRLRFSARRRR